MALGLPVALAVLGAALLHASWNALVKASADKHLDTVAIAIGAGLIGIALAPWLPAPARAAWPWLAASALVHVAYFRLLAGAYRWGELSFSYPIMRGGGPALVAIVAAFVFGEVLPWPQAAGVALICAGIVAFASSPGGERAALRRPLAFALGNAVVIATYTVIDAEGVRRSGSPVAYTLYFFAASAVTLYLASGWRYGAALPRYLARHWRRVALGAGCITTAYAVALWAMTRAPVALVAALRETSVVFGAALGVFFLGERLTRRRVAATAAVLAGLIALRLRGS